MSRQTLVLLHGWGMHGGIWGEFGRLLAERYEVICPDLPGYGGTQPVEPYTVAALAESLRPELPERAVVLGWSLGGMVAMHLAALCPERVERLILVGSSPRFCRDEGWPEAMLPGMLDAFEAQMRGDPGATLFRFLAIQSLGGEDARSQTALLKRFIGERPLPSEETLRAGLAILRHGDLRGLLPVIRQPVCLIQGEQDTVVPAGAARALAGLLTGSRLHVLPGCAHAPFLTRPEEVAGIVERFLAGTVEYRASSVERNSCVSQAGKLAPSAPHSSPAAGLGVKRAFERAAGSYDQAADVQRDVARRLADRLDGVLAGLARRPRRVLDAGSGTGYGEKLLREHLPDAQLVELDIAHAMLAVARSNRVGQDCLPVCADLERLPLVGASVDLVWSSLALQWASRPEQAFRELYRGLTPGGVLHFATLGPGTLGELAESFADVDRYRHVNRFPSLEEVAAALGSAGFEGMRLEQEPLVAEYPDLAGVLKSLRAIGARRVVEEGVPGLMGKARWRQASANYESHRRRGVLPATYQVIYVTAHKRGTSGQ